MCHAGVLQRRMEDGHLLAVLESHLSVAQQSIMRRGAEKAYQDWFVAGHPNWRIWDHMTYDLLIQGVHQQVNVRLLGHLICRPTLRMLSLHACWSSMPCPAQTLASPGPHVSRSCCAACAPVMRSSFATGCLGFMCVALTPSSLRPVRGWMAH